MKQLLLNHLKPYGQHFATNLLAMLTLALVLLPQSVWAQGYGLTVAGVEVTSENAANVTGANITGTGSVSYDNSSSTLTLSGVTLGGNIVVANGTTLIIKVSGQNVINGGASSALQSTVSDNAVQLSFVKEGTGDCSLELNSTEVTVISTGFSTPTYTDLALVVDGVDYPNYYTNDGLAYYDSKQQSNVAITSATITSYETYGIIVSGEAVTNLNKDKICKGTVGAGHILFDGDYTLTLNNVPNMVFNGTYPFIQTSMDLTINIVGTSYFDCGQSVFITRMAGDNDTHTVTFTTDADNPGMLTMQAGDTFDGFDKAYENGLTWKPAGYYSTNDQNGPAAWVALPFLGGGAGTSESPYLIKSANDLASFANSINSGVIASDVFVQLYQDIDCSTLEGFTPIGDYSKAFSGTFDGNNKTISNLSVTGVTSEEVGLFRYLATNGTIKDLTLYNFTLSGGNLSSNQISAFVAVMNGGTVTNCKLQNSSISCLTNSQNPTVGGIVGQLNGGSVSNCTVQSSSIKAQTSDKGTSGANANAGGIAGAIIDGTISGCQVKGTTTVLADYGNYLATVSSGAIVAKMNGGTLTNNTYEYSVTTTTITYNDYTETTDTTVKKDYEQRGTGTETAISDVFYYDIVEDNGAVLYNTKKLTIDMEHIEEGGPNGCYEPLSNYQKGEFYLVPGQETTVILQPADGYTISTSSASLMYAETEGADPTAHTINNSVQEGYQYTFTMPDAEATLSVTVSAKPSIWIGSIEVAQDGSFPEYGDNASFDFDTNTLTLNGLGYSGYIKSGLDHLTISLVSNEYGNALGQVISLNPEATLTFVKASNDATGVLGTLSASTASNSVIEGFASVDFGDLNLLSAPYQYDTTAKKLINLSLTNEEDNGITSATLTTATAYPLWVAGNQVTGENVTGDGISKNGEIDEWGVTFSSNTLLLKNVYLSTANDQTPAIVSGLDALTLQIEGYNSMSFGTYNTYGGFIVQSTNSAATLTVEAVDDESSLNLTFGTDLYINNPFNNFSSVTYSGKTIYVPGTGCQYISNIKTPYYYNGDYLTISSADGDYGRNVISYYYTIDYVDEGTADVETPTLFEESLPSISTPCIVMAYAQYSYNGVTKSSDNVIAKYFGFTEPLRVSFSGTAFELTSADLPALVPTIADGDDVTYEIGGVSEGEAISFFAETGKYRVEGPGTAVLNININQGDNTPYQVLNEVAQLTVNVVYEIPLDVAFVGTNSWASYYATEDLALPEGLTAYIVSDVNATSGVVTAQSVGYIPANNGVLLQREANGKADGYVAEAFTGTTSTFNNLLAGSANTTDVSSLNGGPVYVLFNDKFKRATSGTIPARRAYLPLAVAPAGAPQLMTLNVVDGDITAIRTLAADDNDGTWYTLDGFKLSGKPQHKGLYIKNGKKVFFNNK